MVKHVLVINSKYKMASLEPTVKATYRVGQKSDTSYTLHCTRGITFLAHPV